ncbi:MAG: cupredoxin domain-containing protein [Actinomycetota bacterium]
MRVRVLVGLSSIVLLGTACGGSGTGTAPNASPPTTTPPATTASPTPQCSAEGKVLELRATGTEFDTNCLAAPADTPFRIRFEITDGVAHNVVIVADELFTGEVVTGPTTTTYRVHPIAAGTYRFYCQVHPSRMQGMLIAE